MTERQRHKELEALLTPELQTLAHYVKDNLLPEGWGFMCLMLPFDGESMLWVSNAQRDDAIKALRETADKLESGEADG